MKQYFKGLAFASTLVLVASCTNQTQESGTSTESPKDTVAVLAEDTTAVMTQDSTQSKVESIAGEVKEVTNGKDGYTAKIVTSDKKTYFATISHANLGDNASQYRSVKVGETITVKGEVWKMGEEDHVTVRELK